MQSYASSTASWLSKLSSCRPSAKVSTSSARERTRNRHQTWTRFALASASTRGDNSSSSSWNRDRLGRPKTLTKQRLSSRKLSPLNWNMKVSLPRLSRGKTYHKLLGASSSRPYLQSRKAWQTGKTWAPLSSPMRSHGASQCWNRSRRIVVRKLQHRRSKLLNNDTDWVCRSHRIGIHKFRP